MFDSSDDESSEGEDTPVRTEIIKVKQYAEVLVPAMRDETFRRHFRMSPSTFQQLLEQLSPLLDANFGIVVYIWQYIMSYYIVCF